MKYILITFATIVLFLTQVQAQTSDYSSVNPEVQAQQLIKSSRSGQWKTSITMGTAIPFGDMSSTESDSISGFSKIGFTLAFEAGYNLKARWTVGGKLFVGNSTLDKVAASEMLYQRLEPLIDNFGSEYNDDFAARIGYWLWSSIMVGGKYNIPIQRWKSHIEVSAYTGLSITQVPQLDADFTANEFKYYTTQIDNNTISLPINGGIAYNLTISDAVQMRVAAEYFYTKVTYDYNSFGRENSSDSNIPFELDEKYQGTRTTALNMANFGIGLVYKLN